MSIKQRRISTSNDEPVLVIEVRGYHDIYRFSDHLRRGQCEFADIGRTVQRSLKRRMGAARWKWLLNYMHGTGMQ